jgi:hypothetical protein
MRLFYLSEFGFMRFEDELDFTLRHLTKKTL